MVAAIKWKMVSSFFGFLLMSEDRGGVGLAEDRLSLVLLSDASLVVQYINFRKARSGCFTGETYAFLRFCVTLLRKKTGYLRQLPKMVQHGLDPCPMTDWKRYYGRGKDEGEKKSEKSVDDFEKTGEKWDKTQGNLDKTKENLDKTQQEWENFCERNREKILKVARQLKKGSQIKKGRDPAEPIAVVLNNQHPIDVLCEMIRTMEREQCQIISERRRALHVRDIVLIKMLTINPLRRHHYSIMTYKENEGGNLIRGSNGSWALHFEAEDFKNQNGAAHGPYDVILSKSIWKQIQEYLSNYRRVLFNADRCDYVFLSLNDSKHDGMWPADAITRRVKVLTQRYIPHCPGFGPHAFRHIVATDYLKNNPNGYQVVANILHDKLETVLREYAHLKTADGFSHWTSYLDSRIEKVERGEE
jgi:integrase